MKKIKYTTGLLCTAALLALPLGCGKRQNSDDPAEPVKLTVWVYYNGDQLESFNQLVAEFNDTTGREKGIIVDSYSQGTVNDLETNVMASAQG